MKNLILVVIVIAVVWWLQSSPSVDDVRDTGGQLSIGEYRITPLQEQFEISARVLGRKDYTFGREADLSPMDLALGWGPMADPEVIAAFDISQSGRWYRWRAQQLPIPLRSVQTHSANMHMVPANQLIAARLNDIREGDLIELSGQLIRADAPDGWRWISSLTRNDTGDGSCELVLVEDVRVVSDQ